jgi:hypothetical protein
MSTSSTACYWELLVDHLGPLWPKALLLAILTLPYATIRILNPQIVRCFLNMTIANSRDLAWGLVTS